MLGISSPKLLAEMSTQTFYRYTDSTLQCFTNLEIFLKIFGKSIHHGIIQSKKKNQDIIKVSSIEQWLNKLSHNHLRKCFAATEKSC